MAQQGNLPGTGGDLSPHNMTHPLGSQVLGSMDIVGMDHIGVAGIANSSQPVSHLGRPGDSLDGLAPIFPPQNFDVPDISFSNSVSPNADFNQSLLNSAEMYGASGPLYTNVSPSSGHMMGTQQVGYSQPQQGQAGTGEQMTYFPAASSSPPGTSSSDDSDDLPLAQLAKRVVLGSSASNAGANASIASPTAQSTDTTSMEGSPTPAGPSKKTKQSKRKKKKDPNEPQKPVSAYALFFRDTQATIKGHNPSASFGEVSKIVASMWDQLDPEHKDVYKKKTEMAKKQYLKQLAAYRASQVSQSASEEADKSPSPPGMGGNILVGGIPGSSGFQSLGGGPQAVNMAGQMIGQQQQSPPHMMQMSPQMMRQQMLQQQQQMSMGQASQSPQQHSPTQQMSPVAGPVYTSPPHVAQTGSAMMDHNNVFGFPEPDVNMDVNYPQCVRRGCRNHGRENPAWDLEYCSNECVITHCRDIFKNWVASRSGSNSYPVK